ncbi:hypothetical protein [Streptosporangium saharense]|uniref:hypothetical protein n=1 Tax=Streptosporangium saharense TaxID=1706840 RepID=UPI0033254CD2
MTRLGVDHLRSARVRRETYVGDRLPGPVVVSEERPGPAELADALSTAFLVLLDMLAPHVVLHGDGGGRARSIGRPATGPRRVARMLVTGLRRLRMFGLFLRPAWINGAPGGVMYDAGGRVTGVLGLDIADDPVLTIHSVVNPDKLHHLGPVSDVARLPGK